MLVKEMLLNKLTRAAITYMVMGAISSCAAAGIQQSPKSQLDPAVANPARWKAATVAAEGRKPAAPVIYLDTKYAAPRGRKIRVAAGASASRNLQTALEQAEGGDLIELEAGADYTGNFTLPFKASSSPDFITIRSSRADDLIAGTRVSPADSPKMARMITPNADPVLRAANGAHHFRLIGIELTLGAGVEANKNLVRLGEGDETQLAQLPHDIIIDRCYIHGSETKTLRRGVALNSASTAIIDCYISEVHEKGADSQAICGWNGAGPFKIVNNYLEASGENIMFGGADPRIEGLVPSDIEIRRNHLRKRTEWKKGEAGYDGTGWTVKNLLELKNAQRVVIEGNVMENCWVEAQVGYAVVLKSANQDGSAAWSVTQDVEMVNNVIRRASGGVNIQGRSEEAPGGQTKRIRIKNNLIEEIGGERWGGEGAFMKISETEDVEVDHNTVLQTGSVIVAYGVPNSGFVFTNNIVRHGLYGVKGDGTATGVNTVNKYFPGSLFKKNVLIGAQDSPYPEGNFLPASIDKVGFVDHATKMFRLADKSTYKKAGTDGLDIGCDLSMIEGAANSPSAISSPARVAPSKQ
jgi:hypothetical protein